jgi:S1-C subfamily serine protease
MIVTITHLTGTRRGACEEFTDEIITVGRAADNRLCLGDGERRVSSHHAQITRHGDAFLIRDLGSTNGTMINGRRIVIGELNRDDLIEFGAGGPLVRFNVSETTQPPETSQLSFSQDSNAQVPKRRDFSRKERLKRSIKRFLRQRKNNVRLTTAIVISMILGAAFGIWLSSRFNSLDNEQLSFAAIAERNSAAVVFIRCEFELLDSAGNVVLTEARTGSGFVISPSGLIVTNRHLVRDWEYNEPPAGMTGRTKKIEVVFQHKHREEAIPATVAYLSSDVAIDLVILKITPPPEMPVVYGLEPNLNRVNQGDEVATIGYPLGVDLLQMTNEERIEPSLSTGVVSRVAYGAIQLNLHAYHGNSGGPVLNRRGEVIAIIKANLAEAQELTLCEPIGVVFEIVGEDLLHQTEPESSKGNHTNVSNRDRINAPRQ